jgi:glutathione S-transferase
MDKLTLYIGNKNYSSWSFRPWMAMTGCGISFEDKVIPFDFPAGNPRFFEISPTGRVPVLYHGHFRVWESLAIIEYVAELFPDAGLWPGEPGARAEARAISCEMLAGFRALRNACPMNLRRPKRQIDLPEGVKADVARIETIRRDFRSRSGGPFLFGTFSAADAMFAPVVSRFETYDLACDPDTRGYMETMQRHPAFQKWLKAALQETWIVPEDEA